MSEIWHWKSGIGGQVIKLINANRLKDAITKTRMNCQKALGADYKEGVIETLEVIERTLADMPAGYDVEKVINKLRDAKDTPRDDSFIEKLTTRMWNKAIDEAIRIVEAGVYDDEEQERWIAQWRGQHDSKEQSAGSGENDRRGDRQKF